MVDRRGGVYRGGTTSGSGSVIANSAQSWVETFTATASQTVVTLVDHEYLINTDALDVYVNGLRYVSGVDYIESNATTITFTTPLDVDDSVVVVGRTYVNTVDVVTVLDSTDAVNVKDYGATGDGVTDDTAAIQRALDTTSKFVYFPTGVYRISQSVLDGTPALRSTVQGRRIVCDGVITATSEVRVAFRQTGQDAVIQLNFDGNNYIADAIQVQARGCVVERCFIKNLRSTNYQVTGVRVDIPTGGVTVRNNDIRNLESVGDGTTGNGNGLTRAIILALTGDATEDSVIHDNVIENIIGEEGDAIGVLAYDGTNFYDARLTIRNNTVRDFNKRGVKIQANHCNVIDNYFTNTWTSSAQVPNALTVIDIQEGGNAIISDNILDNCLWFSQINLFRSSPETVSYIFIENNKILGLGSETSDTVIGVIPRGSNVFVRGNYVEGGTGIAINLSDTTNAVVEDNVCQVADAAGTAVISFSASVVAAIAKGNTLLRGARQAFVSSLSPRSIVADNHLKCNTPMFRNNGGSGNNVVINNTIDGTSGLVSGTNVNIGNRIGPNYQTQDQANFHAGPLYTGNSGGPAVAFAGLNVRQGQIVFDETPTAGGYIGWVAMSSGLAQSITWKQFGAILP